MVNIVQRKISNRQYLFDIIFIPLEKTLNEKIDKLNQQNEYQKQDIVQLKTTNEILKDQLQTIMRGQDESNDSFLSFYSYILSTEILFQSQRVDNCRKRTNYSRKRKILSTWNWKS